MKNQLAKVRKRYNIIALKSLMIANCSIIWLIFRFETFILWIFWLFCQIVSVETKNCHGQDNVGKDCFILSILDLDYLECRGARQRTRIVAAKRENKRKNRRKIQEEQRCKGLRYKVKERKRPTSPLFVHLAGIEPARVLPH